MANLTRHSTVTLSYARALLELANRQQQAVPIGDELREVRQVIEQDPLYAQFFADPAIGQTDRSAVLEKVFLNRVSELMFNFVSVLDRHRRMNIIAQLADAYADLLAEQLNKIDVEVTVAAALTDLQLDEVRQKVSSALHKEAVLHQYVDESIIGGLILRAGDRQIDGSVRRQLEAMKEKMLAAQPQ